MYSARKRLWVDINIWGGYEIVNEKDLHHLALQSSYICAHLHAYSLRDSLTFPSKDTENKIWTLTHLYEFQELLPLPRSSQNFQRRTLINRVLQCLFCAAIREHQGCSQSIATMKYGIYEWSDGEESHALIHFHEPFHNRLFKVRKNKTFPAHRIQAHLVPRLAYIWNCK